MVQNYKAVIMAEYFEYYSLPFLLVVVLKSYSG
jgi:hypothetical protein